jgi:hypothetical protein
MSYAIYYDYTGAGRMPEPVAGPFKTHEEACTYADEEGYDSPIGNYFIDKYPLYEDG